MISGNGRGAARRGSLRRPAACIALVAWTLGMASPALGQDAEQAYLEARRALNRLELDAAVDAFRAFRRDYPESSYVGDSYYWEGYALERLGDLEGAVEVVDMLLEEHPDASTRDDARALRLRVCSELARRGDSECAEDVASTVRDPAQLDDATRMAAVSALINMRAERAVPIAAQVAANRQQPLEVRKQALFVLADKAEDDEAVESQVLETLRRVALDETDDAEVRAQAVFWLSEVPGDETLSVLEALLTGNADAELKDRAIFALSQHDGPEAMRLLQEAAENEALALDLRERAIFWIGDEGGAEGLPFLSELYPKLTNDELKRQVLFAISETGADDAAEWLLGRAEDASETVELRQQALFWAAEAGVSAESLSRLYRRFDEPELREYLIWLIAEEGGEGSLETLIDVARTDPDPEMRQKAIFWIGESSDERADEFLLELLGQ